MIRVLHLTWPLLGKVIVEFLGIGNSKGKFKNTHECNLVSMDREVIEIWNFPRIIPIERPHTEFLLNLMGMRSFVTEYEELWMGNGLESSFDLETLFGEEIKRIV